MLQPGTTIPDITLQSHAGEPVRLHDFVGKKPLVIYFYPKDGTSGCTAEACSFRDHYEDFSDLGAEVIGISRDSVQSHARVVERRRLPFILLSDPKKIAEKAFGVPPILLGFLPGRVTFIVDKQGTIISTFKSNRDISGHIQESLKALKALS
jgi:thioredoxin-dependent peroxiredoxin